MTSDQDDVTTMFETTNSTLANNEALWSAIPAFADAVSRVKAGTKAIRDKAGEQAPTGDAKMKEDLRTDLEEKALVIADVVAALAAKTADHNLGAQVDFNKSQLDRMADSDLLVAVRSVAAAAASKSNALATDYAIPATQLAELDRVIALYDTVKTSPREAVVLRKVATMSLPEAVSYVRSIYRNELDKMMTRFKKQAPDFYSAYFAARVIVNRAATHASPKKAPPVVKPV